MCGILSIAGNQPIPDKILVQIDDFMARLAHRGPNHQGTRWVDERVLMGSTRLSIIDPSSAGHMPLQSAQGDCWIIYNGETYNYVELRDILKSKGFVFRSTSDTEVVVNAYLHWGDTFVERLNGIFAFVIYDCRRRRLIAARDRFGAKPLYYTSVDSCLIYSSEFLPLREVASGDDSEIGRPELTAWIQCRFVPGERTVARNVFKLRPGEIRTTSLDDLQTHSRTFWSPTLMLQPFDQRVFDERLDRALSLVRQADVTPSLLLSGGLDSSATAAIWHRQNAGEVELFGCAFARSVAMIDADTRDSITTPNIDERPYAVEAAEFLGRTCTEIEIDVAIERETFESMLRAFGEPNGSPNALGLYLFGAKIAGRTRLAVAGTGADELLGGYAQLYFGSNHSTEPVRDGHKLMARFADFDHGNIPPVSLLRPEFVDHSYMDSFIEGVMEAFTLHAYPGERLNQLAVLELALGLPGWELEQADRMFMAHSIELRPAFLENEFVDYCLTIPSRVKHNKQPLIDAVSTLLPASVLQRRKHPGLSTPLAILEHSWFRELMQDLLQNPSECWNPEAVQRLIARPSFDLLYRVVYLDTWLKRMLTEANR